MCGICPRPQERGACQNELTLAGNVAQDVGCYNNLVQTVEVVNIVLQRAIVVHSRYRDGLLTQWPLRISIVYPAQQTLHLSMPHAFTLTRPELGQKNQKWQEIDNIYPGDTESFKWLSCRIVPALSVYEPKHATT
jgi:hypothetical protein